ncbi:MAG: four helix bundle protein [Tepidisphaeraceae bacterium]
MAGQNYRDLQAWQRSMDLAAAVYRFVRMLPDDERFGLSSQLRRAAVSIPSNIAEGQGRAGPAEFARFLNIAHGSLREVETQLLLCVHVGLSTDEEIAEPLGLCAVVGRLINGLRRHLRDSAS